jgi:ribonucleoside-diphosphate reductase alpha chain
MNTANWIPDLFMKRVFDGGEWTLFSPRRCARPARPVRQGLRTSYEHYEAIGARGKHKLFKAVKAENLWRKMLSMLFETGHPWITFKDPCNLRSPQQHVGVVHSSNLCTEITLNTDKDEIAVCNLGSVNLPQHIDENGRLDLAKLQRTVRTAVRMLDNVIDINYYSVPQAAASNLRHRPVGLGLMGFQDALYKQHLAYGSEAVAFADQSMEAISYYAIQASSELATERGAYSSYEGSLWSQGILPIDSQQRSARL